MKKQQRLDEICKEDIHIKQLLRDDKISREEYDQRISALAAEYAELTNEKETLKEMMKLRKKNK